jgi:hypothetical protein
MPQTTKITPPSVPVTVMIAHAARETDAHVRSSMRCWRSTSWRMIVSRIWAEIRSERSGGLPVRRTRPCAQAAQAHQLGQVTHDHLERASATWAQVVAMILRGTVAPHPRPAGRAFGMRHDHASFGVVAARRRVVGARSRRLASCCLRARTCCTLVARSRSDRRLPAAPGVGAGASPHFQQRSAWPAIGAWQRWHRRGSWRLRVILISGVGQGDIRASSPRAFGIVDSADSAGSMRSPFQASAAKTGSEASERCALAPDTLADTALRRARRLYAAAVLPPHSHLANHR